jgi:hypothetical protein
MGHSLWSDDHYRAKVSFKAASRIPMFAYDADVKAGKVDGKVHDLMDPKRKALIESRDSDAHPDSNAIAVVCDVTGSMRRVPQIVQAELPKLMGLLLRKGYIADPQILVGAIGDATCDRYPLQVGEFESGTEIEDCLTRLILEGGGGGFQESYELAMYFMARHTAIDCFEKRGRRGYLFFLGDELPYNVIDASQVQRLIGDTIQGNIPTAEIVEELQRRYDCYFILPGQASNRGDSILRPWRDLFGQNVIELPDAANVCECIAGAIGVAEGAVLPSELEGHLVDAGTGAAAAAGVSRALSKVAPKGGKGPSVDLPALSSKGGVATL